MNREHDDHDFDSRMRALHATALGATSPQTLARLRLARQHATAAPARHGPRWLLAALPAVLAVAFGLHLSLRPAVVPPAPGNLQATVAADAFEDPDALPLEENPDLYVWLGSTSLAME